MKKRFGALPLLLTVIFFTGCAAPQAQESLEEAVLRLRHPERLTVNEAVARLRESLEHRRNAGQGSAIPVRVTTALRIAPGCSPDEKARAERLADKIFHARELLLAAGGLTEEHPPDRTRLHFVLELEALPGAGAFVQAELEENETILWREVLPVTD